MNAKRPAAFSTSALYPASVKTSSEWWSPPVTCRGMLVAPDELHPGGIADRPQPYHRLMLEGKRVGVVVPAHDEEGLIAATVQGIPGFVDRIYVIDDASNDATAERARGVEDPRVEVFTHDRNRGVGAAIVTGYKRALAERMDVTAVMAGDNQMDPDELEPFATPVVRDQLDYAKANRLFTGSAWKLIPRNRYLGNAVLSLLTK